MIQTLLMERVLDQTRLAVIEDSRLCELYIERPDSENLSGNIYLGCVERVLPGMNAAFVDIGMEKNGFLAADDIRLDVRGESGLESALKQVRIEGLVRPGQEIVVQAIKSQPGGKGPRLSSHITLPGRLMVLLTGIEYVGVSRKIADEEERSRLYGIGKALASREFGLILRTAALGVEESALREEFDRLTAMYRQMRERAAHAIAPKLLHDDNALVLRAVRDMLNENVDCLWVDDDDCLTRARACAGTLCPDLADRIRRHEGDTPLFDLYRVDAQADKATQKYVWLKSGGSLVIEETEAMTVVDVNTAKNIGKRASQETLFENNCEAARELMRQLRLRDIGGIIVADFIDMPQQRQRDALLEVLRECAALDRTHVTVVDITPLGLVELTRKKQRQSLSRQLTHTCSRCGGNGVVPSHETTARRVSRELWRSRRGGNAAIMLVEAAPPVCGWLRKLGAPEGGAVYLRPVEGMEAGEYRISPAEPGALPPDSKRLK